MYFKSCEMDEAFDRFIVSLAKSSAEHSDFFYVSSGQTLSKDIRNYVLVLHQNREHQVQLSIAEYRISIYDYQHVQSRDKDIEKITQSLPTHVSTAKRTQRYLILANLHDGITLDDVQIIDQAELERQSVQQYPQNMLNMLRVARIDRKLGATNIYDFLVKFGNSKKTIKQLLSMNCSEPSTLRNPYYRLDPIIRNGMNLMDLYEASPDAELGLFVIREAMDNSWINHVQPARQLSELTDTTRFFVNDTIAFEELCRLRLNGNCHEVIYRPDYGLVYWMRSSSSTNRLRPFLSSAFEAIGERYIPQEHWLNGVYAEQSAGKSEFLRFLQREFRRLKAFSAVRMIDGAKLEELNGLSMENKLKKIFEVETAEEFEALQVLMKHPGEVLLLIDDIDHFGCTVVQFLNEFEACLQGSVKVWVAADGKVRDIIEDNFPVVCHEFPVMDEDEQTECFKVMVPHLKRDQAENVLDLARKQNTYVFDGFPIRYTFTGNAFHLMLVAKVGLEDNQSKYEADLLEEYVRTHYVSENQLFLEEKCYRIITENQYDPVVRRLCQHSTVMEYLAACYLAKRFELITLELYRKFRSLGNMLDRILVRNCNLSRAVLNKDLDQVQANLEQYATSCDILRRTPLHLCQSALPIAEVLISITNDFEARCLLSDYTPLQMADERRDWQLVDVLLRRGANVSFPSLRLRTMAPNELVKTLNSCIVENLLDLTRWILTNRPDFQITQLIIHTLSFHNTFDPELTDRILQLAFDQGLPNQKAPCRFMYGQTALHIAASIGRLEFCRFLVDKLKFDVDDEDNTGKTAVEDATDVAVRKFLTSKTNRKVRKNTVSGNESNKDLEGSQDSIFFRACYSDNLDLVRYVVEQEGHNPIEQECGSYGLIQAAAWGSLPIVQYLYDVGFHDHLDLENGSGYTALATAVCCERFNAVKFLIEKGANTEKIRDTPANPELLNFMIKSFDFKPGVNFDSLANLPLEDLRANTFDFTTKNNHGYLFLHHYVDSYNDPELLRFILTKYDNIDLECQVTGKTALHIALTYDKLHLVDVLLEAGADIRKRSSRTGQSVVHFCHKAINSGHLDLFLSDSDLTINDRDNDGQTIMFYLYLIPTLVHVIRYLADHYGMDINARNNKGQSVLHKTIINQSNFYLDEWEVLLRDVGMRQNLTDLEGRLALHYAVEQDQREAVRLMGRYGYLEPDVKDRSGKSPRMLAEELNRTEILQYFDSI